MTREDVIRMALEHFGAVLKPSDLEVKLAMLAVVQEREACARIADKCIEDSQKVTPESEQEENYLTAMRILSEEFAIAIRARGEA